MVAIKGNSSNTNNKIFKELLPNYMFEYLIQTSYWFSHHVHQRSCHGEQHMGCWTTRSKGRSSRNGQLMFYRHIRNGRSEDPFAHQKAYGNVHHAWMLRIYKCMDIPKNVIT